MTREFKFTGDQQQSQVTSIPEISSPMPRPPIVPYTPEASLADDNTVFNQTEKGKKETIGGLPGKEFTSPTDIPAGIKTEASQEWKPLLEGVLKRRGFYTNAIEEIRTSVPFPDIILIPTKSQLKTTFFRGFMNELVPDKDSAVYGTEVSSGVHENPFGPETLEGAKNRKKNAEEKALSGKTGDEELDKKLNQMRKEGKPVGYIGAFENGMVAGRTDTEGNIYLDLKKTEYDPNEEHFDIAYAIIHFPPYAPIIAVSPPEEAVRFDPRDADASAATGFNITAGQLMKERLAQEGVSVDKQNWHGYTVQKEITAGLRPESDAGFDRFEQLAGVLFDAFYQLAQQIKEASE